MKNLECQAQYIGLTLLLYMQPVMLARTVEICSYIYYLASVTILVYILKTCIYSHEIKGYVDDDTQRQHGWIYQADGKVMVTIITIVNMVTMTAM